MAEPEVIADPTALPAPPVGSRSTTVWMSLFEVVATSGLPSQLALSLLLMLAGYAAAADGGLSFGFVVTLSLLDSAVIIGLVVLFLRARGESVRSALFGHRRWRGEIWRGVTLLPVVFAIVAVGGLVIQQVAPSLHNVTTNPLQAMLDTPWKLAFFAVVVVIAGGVREEVQRAFILRRFEQDLGGVWLGLVLFSIAFGLGHTVQGFDAAILTGILGFVWGLVFLARRSLIAPVVSHALFNLSELAIFYYAARTGLIGG